MSSRPRMRLVILCEDLQQEVFARHFFMSRGFLRHELDFKRSIAGKGSGEQYVRTRYAQEVKKFRKKSTYIKSIRLVVIIDADKHTVNSRLNQLDSALEEDGQPKRQPNEKMAIPSAGSGHALFQKGTLRHGYII